MKREFHWISIFWRSTNMRNETKLQLLGGTIGAVLATIAAILACIGGLFEGPAPPIP